MADRKSKSYRASAKKNKGKPSRSLSRETRPTTAPERSGAQGESLTLCIDVGGTGIKMLVLDGQGRPVNERARVLTPKPATPKAVLDVIRSMLEAQPPFDRVAVGFPGIVVDGVVHSAVNLGDKYWKGEDFEAMLERLTGVPVRVINDADLQGYGVITGRGVELVLTLGTGLGSALFVNGHLVPNLELGHHPFTNGKTYEQRVGDRALKRVGKKEWSKRVLDALDQLDPIFNYELLHLGGGNVAHLKGRLPDNVRLFTNVDGMTGGSKLWLDR